MKQEEADMNERKANQDRRTPTQYKAKKIGVTDETLTWCYDNYPEEEIEKQVNLLAERNPKNPNALLKAALKGHYAIPSRIERAREKEALYRKRKPPKIKTEPLEV